MKITETSVPIPENDTTKSFQAAMIEESTNFPGGYTVDTATIAVELGKCEILFYSQRDFHPVTVGLSK